MKVKLLAMFVVVGLVAFSPLANADYPDDCNGSQEASGADCGDFTEPGCCDDAGRVVYCLDGALYCIDCAELNPLCGWDPNNDFYDCGTADGAEDPSGDNPIDCVQCDPPCEAGFKCQGGECVVCVPDCEAKACGGDGCGGSCGECGEGLTCSAGQCLVPGCEPLDGPGCGGCPCEACVCELDPYCCDTQWDGLCASACIEDCGGCLALENCGNEVCDAEEGENCANCEDCTCPEGEVCDGGECCAPDCEGKECGDDGCNGVCGECEAGKYCTEGFACEDLPECVLAETIKCDDVIEGDTTDYENLLETYSCEEWDESGPEVGYTFEADADDLLVATIEYADETDLDVFALDGKCIIDNCIAGGNVEVQFEVTAGSTYFIVVDGYGGEAGAYTLSLKCQSTCQPQCDGLECGDDGCWGTCGECDEGGFCDEGLCKAQDGCFPWDQTGCGGCACEACVCEMDPYCCESEWDSQCVTECQEDCGGCGNLENCGDGECQADEGENCGNCAEDCVCEDGESCFKGECCTPSCEGKECGDDGCGGDTCGTCGEGLGCQDGVCVEFQGPVECLGMGEPSAPDCGGVVFEGCCDDLGRVLFCDGGALFCIDCSLGEGECGWKPDAGFYDCGTPDGAEDPTGEFPKSCFGDIPVAECGDGTCDAGEDCETCADDCACADGEECVAGECVVPVGCGDGACGEDENCETCADDCPCADGENCVAGECVGCAPSCEGKDCGADGCGGECGTCEDGFTCSIAGVCEADAPIDDVVDQGDAVVQGDGAAEADAGGEEPAEDEDDGGCSTNPNGNPFAALLFLMTLLGLVSVRRFALNA